MRKPHMWKSAGWWICGYPGNPLNWASAPTVKEALRHWYLGQVARIKALGRFGGGRFGQ